MIQEIITYLIVFWAFAYTIYKSVYFFIPKKNAASGCSSCSTNACGGCSLQTVYTKQVQTAKRPVNVDSLSPLNMN